MTNRTSPTVRRRRLAAELRDLRRASGKPREAVAEYLGVAPSTITRIENADSTAPPPVVAAMLDFYGVVGEEKDQWVIVARQARRRGWWSQYGDTIPDWFKFYVGLEEEASEIRAYEPEAVPGLLQTERYMREIMRSEVEPLPEGDLERRIKLRLKRQERLTGPDAPKLWIVLNEAVVRRTVGGPEVMAEQLVHLAKLSHDRKILIQVLPFTTGAHPALDGAFTLLGFPEPRDRDVVYVQSRRGGLYLEEPEDLNEYTEILNHLRARALGPDDSRELILNIANEMS